MPATIIDGKALAQSARQQVAERVDRVRAAGGHIRLDALLVDSGDNAARVYAQNQARTCRELGIEYKLHELPGDSGLGDVAEMIGRLNADDDATAVMLHLPVPDGVDGYELQRLIAPEKDVEGVNPANIGNIVYGRNSLAPCTALAAIRMIQSVTPDIRGKRAVVVGASNVVGKPLAVLLMRLDATVISANKWTWGIEDLCRSAEILVTAAGVPGLIKPEMVRPGAIVIDVGVTRVRGADGKTRTVGDVDFDGVSGVAGALSPVPGGVGPMTVTVLLENVVKSAERQAGIQVRAR